LLGIGDGGTIEMSFPRQNFCDRASSSFPVRFFDYNAIANHYSLTNFFQARPAGAE
jgi:hypothetical protein